MRFTIIVVERRRDFTISKDEIRKMSCSTSGLTLDLCVRGSVCVSIRPIAFEERDGKSAVCARAIFFSFSATLDQSLSD